MDNVLNNINKKEILFLIKDFIKHISYEDTQFILNEIKSYQKQELQSFITETWHHLNFNNDIKIVIYGNYKLCWFKHNQLHRDNDQPATIFADGFKAWYEKGLYTRKIYKKAFK